MKRQEKNKNIYAIIALAVAIIILAIVSATLLVINAPKKAVGPYSVIQTYYSGIKEEDLSKVASTLYEKDSYLYKQFIEGNKNYFSNLGNSSLLYADSFKVRKTAKKTLYVSYQIDFYKDNVLLNENPYHLRLYRKGRNWFLEDDISKQVVPPINDPNGGQNGGNGHLPNYYLRLPHRDFSTFEIPDGSSIDNETFRGQNKLYKITLPENFSAFDYRWFLECPKLDQIVAPKNSKNFSSVDGVLFNKDKTKLIYYPIGRQRGYQYTIPDTVVTIGENAFRDNVYLSRITFGKSVETIEESAFNKTSNLVDIVLSGKLKDIGNRAFYECSGIKEFNLPPTVTEIGNEAFAESKNLVYFNVPLNTSLKSIGDGAFSNCKSLSKIDIPTSVTQISPRTFQYCINLKEIKLHNKVESIGMYAFRYCNNIKTLHIPIGVKYVGIGAFQGCYEVQISCEAKQMPTAWHNRWDMDLVKPPTWGVEA